MQVHAISHFGHESKIAILSPTRKKSPDPQTKNAISHFGHESKIAILSPTRKKSPDPQTKNAICGGEKSRFQSTPGGLI